MAPKKRSKNLPFLVGEGFRKISHRSAAGNYVDTPLQRRYQNALILQRVLTESDGVHQWRQDLSAVLREVYLEK